MHSGTENKGYMDMVLSVKEILKNKKFLMGRIVGAVLILLILWFLSLSSIPVTTTYSYKEMEDPRENFNMVQGNRIEQTIQFKKPYVERIAVCISNMTYGTQGILKLNLHEKGTEYILAESEINLETAKCREFIWFDVKKEIDTGKMYQLDVITNDVAGEVAILCRNQDTNVGEVAEFATEYGFTLEDTYLAVDIAYRSKLDIHTMFCLWMLGGIIIAYILGWEFIIETRSRLTKSICVTILLLVVPFFYSYCVPEQDAIHTKFYIGLAIYYILLLVITFLLYYKKKITFIPFFALVTLLNGIAYSFVFMPVSSPDEAAHFYESYRLSSIIMGQESSDDYGHVLVRNCDLYEKKTQIDDKYVVQLWEKCDESISKEDEMIVASDYLPYVSAPVLGYVPQALGITFARLLHVNYFWLIYFGRFASLIAFTILASVGVYVAPRAKWIVFLISSFPFLLQEIASYSYDTLIIAFSILLGCYVFKLMEQEVRVSKTQIVALIVICTCFAQFKPIYFPLIGLVLLIPNDKIGFSTIRGIIAKGIVIVMALVAMLFVYYIESPFNMIHLHGEHLPLPIIESMEIEQQLYDGWIHSQESGIVHFSSGVTESAVSYLLHNPLDIFQRILYTIIHCIDWLVLYFFGNYMGGHEIRIPISVTILFVFCFYHIIRRERNKEHFSKNIIMKSYILLLNCVSIFGLMLVSYLYMAPLGEQELIGIQGRYFYPLLITLIFEKCGKNQEKEDDYFIELSLISLVHILTLLYSESIIWAR